MIIHGFQLRIARCATDLTTREVRKRLGLSLTTLARLEGTIGPLVIGEGMRQEGTREPQLVAALMNFYQALGVLFVPAIGDKPPGVLFDQTRIASAAAKPSPAMASAPRRSARQAAMKASRAVNRGKHK